MNKTEIYEKLKGQQTTGGWDMVCCYDETKINEMLAAQYKADRLVKSLDLKFSYPAGFLPGDVTCSMKLDLRAPVIRFEASGTCRLEMKIAAGEIRQKYLESPETKLTLSPDTLKLLATVPIAAVSGKVGGGDLNSLAVKLQAGTDASHPQNTIIEFGEKAKTDIICICLGFENLLSEGKMFELLPVKSADAQLTACNPSLPAAIEAAMTAYFNNNVESIRYTIGGITAKQPIAALNLYPVSCVFNIQTSGARASVNLYIQVTDSPEAATRTYMGEPGLAKPVFPVAAAQVFPLPDGNTAMLAISRNLLVNVYLARQFKRAGWDMAATESMQEGIQLKLSKESVAITKAQISQSGGNCTIFTSSKESGISADFKTTPLVMDLSKESVKFSWEYHQTVSYENSHASGGSGPVVSFQFHEGKIDFTIKCQKENPPEVIQGDQVKFKFSLAKTDFTMETKVTKAKKDGIFGIPFNDYDYANDLAAAIKKDLTATLPTFDVAFEELNLFLVANLLFPGEHSFQIDSQSPMMTPGDFLLFGSISL